MHNKLVIVIVISLCLSASAFDLNNYIMEQRANLGDTSAQYFLGSKYHDGINCKKDDVKAVKWYQMAASKNNVNAQFHLGQIYLFGGVGINKDVEKGLFWMEKAASQGLPEVQSHLGNYYLHILFDLARSEYWFKLAAKNGDSVALASIKFIDSIHYSPKYTNSKTIRERNDLNTTILNYIPALRYKYFKVNHTYGPQTGKIIIGFSINCKGDVIKAEVFDDEINSKELSDMIVSQIKSWKFVPVKNKSDIQDIVYPFVFSE